MATSMMDLQTLTYYNQLLKHLETNPGLKKTIKANSKRKTCAAGGACVGAVVAGPPGALVGGISGFILGSSKAYNSMLNGIRTLSNADKTQLVANVQELVGSSSLESLNAYIGYEQQRELLINTIRSMLPVK